MLREFAVIAVLYLFRVGGQELKTKQMFATDKEENALKSSKIMPIPDVRVLSPHDWNADTTIKGKFGSSATQFDLTRSGQMLLMLPQNESKGLHFGYPPKSPEEDWLKNENFHFCKTSDMSDILFMKAYDEYLYTLDSIGLLRCAYQSRLEECDPQNSWNDITTVIGVGFRNVRRFFFTGDKATSTGLMVMQIGPQLIQGPVIPMIIKKRTFDTWFQNGGRVLVDNFPEFITHAFPDSDGNLFLVNSTGTMTQIPLHSVEMLGNNFYSSSIEVSSATNFNRYNHIAVKYVLESVKEEVSSLISESWSWYLFSNGMNIASHVTAIANYFN